MPYFEPTTAPTDERMYLAIAADIVRDLAPPPTPEPAGYAEKAARAEFLLWGWLKSTKGGALTGKSLSGVSGKSFASAPAVQALVAGVMPQYFKGGSAASIGYVGAFPH